ncbi:reverse transcriptase domain-containing protein [Tanacetum coccineum]|uniref:Reverse transcriptase domain-containing protein n=1 Tax=Tanacetum coccineum TaxID=301880 RepID=A0ABQ4ZD45_9ASTR
MAKEDEEKTTFITSQGIFCYSKMPFGLKNARATYQRLVDKAFQRQIGRNLEVYVDDLVIKSRTEQEIMRDIEETFRTLREINMKPNPKNAPSGWRKAYVQKLNQKLASLNRFLSKLAEKSLLFFKTLKKCTKKSDFQWTTEAEAAFKQMKKANSKVANTNRTYGKRRTDCVPCGCTRSRKRSVNDRKGGEANASLLHFIVERPEKDSLVMTTEAEEELPDPWTLFKDGSSCIDGSGAGLILTNPEGTKFTYAPRFRFDATNNEAEYEALIAGLRIAEQMGIKNLQANVDSRLVANQVPRSENKKADALSKIVSTNFAHLTKQVLVEDLNEKSINEAEVLAVVEEEGDTWMTPIYEFLTEETLPVEREKARVVRRKSRRYAVINGVLYKKSYLGPWLQDNPLKDWCEKLCTRQCFASVKHPQANGLVERANRSLGEGIKARLDARSKDWIEEEVVIPAEIGMPTLRTAEIDMVQNDEALEINLDLLEERREQAAIREAKSKANMEKYYNSKVRNTSFKPGDLVYRNNDASHAKDSKAWP